jgi:polar amino acid transport system substrate-binding protein
MRVGPVLITAVLLFSGCSDLPRDQEDTFKHIKGTGRLRVGLIENPPWVIRTSDEPAGAEVELIRQFAAEHGAQPEWHWGGEEKLLGALEKFELDLVAGGFSDSTPWRNRIGLTSAFYREKFDIGVPAGERTVTELTGREISVGDDARLTGFLREQDAVPVESGDSPEKGARPVAAPEWKLQKLGLTPSGSKLHTDRHVIATSPGANHLVKRLDEFLSARKGEIPSMLQRWEETK